MFSENLIFLIGKTNPYKKEVKRPYLLCFSKNVHTRHSKNKSMGTNTLQNMFTEMLVTIK